MNEKGRQTGKKTMRRNETQNEAARIWQMLRPQIIRTIEDETKNCIRMKQVTVSTAPNGTTIGVQQPNDPTIFNIPYVAALSGAKVGQTVLIQYWYGMSNAIAVSFGDGAEL